MCTAQFHGVPFIFLSMGNALPRIVQASTYTAVHFAIPPGSCLRPKDKDSDLTNILIYYNVLPSYKVYTQNLWHRYCVTSVHYFFFIKFFLKFLANAFRIKSIPSQFSKCWADFIRIT